MVLPDPWSASLEALVVSKKRKETEKQDSEQTKSQIIYLLFLGMCALNVLGFSGVQITVVMTEKYSEFDLKIMLSATVMITL